MKQYKFFTLVVLLIGSLYAYAQNDDFNPATPAEPMRFKVTLSASEPGINAVLKGAAEYTYGTPAQISQQAPNGYEFLYWTLNGEQYSTRSSFTYTVQGNAEFVAVYNKVKEVYTITFVDRQGEVLWTGPVVEGSAAPAPAAPRVEGYAFYRWSQSISHITGSATIRPIYVPIQNDGKASFVALPCE